MIDQFHGGSLPNEEEQKAEKRKPVEAKPQPVKPEHAEQPVQSPAPQEKPPHPPVMEVTQPVQKPVSQVAPLPAVETQAPQPTQPAAAAPAPKPVEPTQATPAPEPLPAAEVPASLPKSPAEPPQSLPPTEPASTTLPVAAMMQAPPASAQPKPLPAEPKADDSNLRDQQEEEQETEAAFEAAMQLIAAGQEVEQVLGGGDFANLPEHIKQQLRARLQQVAAQREMQQHEMAKQTREKGLAAKAVGKLFSLGMMSGIISKGTMDKINAMFAQQPNLQQQIQMTGQTLLKAGATPDIEFAKSNVQIASKAASTPAVQQEQEQQR